MQSKPQSLEGMAIIPISTLEVLERTFSVDVGMYGADEDLLDEVQGALKQDNSGMVAVPNIPTKHMIYHGFNAMRSWQQSAPLEANALSSAAVCYGAMLLSAIDDISE